MVSRAACGGVYLVPKQPPSFKPLHHRTDKQRYKDNNKYRGSTTERGYGWDWQKRRLAYLMDHPVCVRCGYPAKVVDHVIPKAVGGADDESNFQALCLSCHNAKSAKERWI